MTNIVTKTVKVFQINEDDWYAGDCSKEEILTAYMEDNGCSLEEATGYDATYPIELTEDQLHNIKFKEELDNGAYNIYSFRERLDSLISAGSSFPCFFASLTC